MTNSADTRRKRSRQRILAAAEETFLKKGFLGTNMDEVSEAAGMSKQTVYAHFRSKETLFRDVVVAMTGGAAQVLGEDSKDDLPGKQSVEDYLRDVSRKQLEIVLTPRLMQLRRMVVGEVERFPDLGEALFENGPGKSIRRFARAFAHYTSAGQLNTPDPESAATYFNWILMGAPTNAAMLLGDAALPGHAERERHVRESVRIFLSAFGVSTDAG